MFLQCSTQEEDAPFPEVMQYRVDARSGWSKPLFHLQVPKINLIYGPRIGDVSDIKLIRTDTTLDLSQKAEKRWPVKRLTNALPQQSLGPQSWYSGAAATACKFQEACHVPRPPPQRLSNSNGGILLSTTRYALQKAAQQKLVSDS